MSALLESVLDSTIEPDLEEAFSRGPAVEGADDDAIESIQPEDIVAKARSYHAALTKAEKTSAQPGFPVSVLAEQYLRADTEREELLELIGDYGQQRRAEGFRDGLTTRSYNDASKGQS